MHMRQEAPLPGELVTDCSWKVDTILLEMNPMLHACYCLRENYTQNLPPLQGAEITCIVHWCADKQTLLTGVFGNGTSLTIF